MVFSRLLRADRTGPIARGLEIGAKILFHQFIGFLQQIMLNRKLADGALQGLKLALQFFALWRSA